MPKLKKLNLALSFFISLFFLILYFITTNQIFSFDAVTNAIACESNEIIRWFHPNHPLYPFLGIVYYRIEKFFGYQGYSIYSLARFNSVLVSVGLGILFYRMSAFIGRWRAASLVLFMGVTYGVWTYAVDGRAIGASVFFSILLITHILVLDQKNKIRARNIFGLSIFSALYVLIHGIAIFHALPVAWWIHQKTNIKKWAMFYLYALAGQLMMIYGAIYVFVIKPRVKISFHSWATGYAGDQGGPRAVGQFWAHGLSEGLHGFWNGWSNFFLNQKHGWIFAALAALIVLCWFIQWGRFVEKSNPSGVFLLWGAIILGFLAIWSPGQEGFRLHVVIPWAVAGWLLMKDSKWWAWGASFTAAILFTLNLQGPLSYAANIKNNQSFQLLNEISRNISKDDMFLCANGSFLPFYEVYRPYFFPQIKGGTVGGRLYAFKENSLEPLEKRIQEVQSQKNKIYFGEDLMSVENQKQLETFGGLQTGAVSVFLDRYKPKPAFSLSNGKVIYVATNH